MPSVNMVPMPSRELPMPPNPDGILPINPPAILSIIQMPTARITSVIIRLFISFDVAIINF